MTNEEAKQKLKQIDELLCEFLMEYEFPYESEMYAYLDQASNCLSNAVCELDLME